MVRKLRKMSERYIENVLRAVVSFFMWTTTTTTTVLSRCCSCFRLRCCYCCLFLQCFDTVGWAAGRASGL